MLCTKDKDYGIQCTHVALKGAIFFDVVHFINDYKTRFKIGFDMINQVSKTLVFVRILFLFYIAISITR